MSDDFDETYDEHDGELPAAPTSSLSKLRAQREEIKSTLYLDLRVPRYDTPLFVRYTPVEASLAKRIAERAKKSRDSEAAVIANAQVLAECCVGVFEKDSSGEPIGTPEDWPKFDKALAAYLGEENMTRAVDVVRALFFTDGDVIATATKLSDWSGFAGDHITEEYEGN